MKLRNGLPFPVELLNKETRDVFEKTDRGEELVECEDADGMKIICLCTVDPSTIRKMI